MKFYSKDCSLENTLFRTVIQKIILLLKSKLTNAYF